MKVMRCEQDHFYDGERYDSCPYCSGLWELGGRKKDEEPQLADNRGMYHVEFWDVTKDGKYNRVYGYAPVPPEVSGRAALKVQKCGNGHYFDGNRNKVCPYCGEAAAETIETI